ncbi:MAG: sigma-70 family RNA polymerase sigma factor [Bacteroidetes bacterium]|nr:MAG: sigma-70 family RNA polymerase sigma factor [Bacteroidota bacterium]
MEASRREEEFNQLVFENQAIIHKICRVYCVFPQDREDLFQEIVFNLWKGFASFRNEAAFSTWLYRVALNTAITQKKKNRNRLGREVKLRDTYTGDAKDEILEQEIQVRALYKGIQQLKKVEKAIILLYLEEKTYQEIADITGLTKTNVSVRLVRIKTKLEKLVKAILSNT